MLTPSYLHTMARYNTAMNRRVYDAANRLGEDARRADRGSFWRSIHGTLSHLVWADRQWMSRLDGWDRPASKLAGSAGEVAGWDEMRAVRPEMDSRMERWAASVPQAWLDGELTWFSGAAGRQVSRPSALVALHLFNHQTHHRGQAHAMITAAGEQTGDTDLFLVLSPAAAEPERR